LAFGYSSPLEFAVLTVHEETKDSFGTFSRKMIKALKITLSNGEGGRITTHSGNKSS
jgi:hypothetical protein